MKVILAITVQQTICQGISYTKYPAIHSPQFVFLRQSLKGSADIISGTGKLDSSMG